MLNKAEPHVHKLYTITYTFFKIAIKFHLWEVNLQCAHNTNFLNWKVYFS